jgi:hypothetical protein
VPAPRARPGRANGCHPPATSRVVLDVNTNTVLRALGQLRDEGLLDFRRRRRIMVAATPECGEVVAAGSPLRWGQFRIGPRGVSAACQQHASNRVQSR